MTKMAATPLHSKNPLKSSSPEPKADDLGTWYIALGLYGLPFLFNDDPRLTLTYLKSRSSLLPNAFQLENF